MSIDALEARLAELEEGISRLDGVINDLVNFLAEHGMTRKPKDSKDVVAERKTNDGTFYLAPANSFWYADISKCPVHKYSENWVRNIGAGTEIHADFGAEWTDDNGKKTKIGIPITLIDHKTAHYHKMTALYAAESDLSDGIPIGTIEDGSDRHSICVDINARRGYEIFNCDHEKGCCDSAAVWDFTSNAMRPMGFTSADAAGLPIVLGQIRYDEIEAGEINHMIRFTIPTSKGNSWPASHMTLGKLNEIYETNAGLGAVFRLKADVDISGFSKTNQIILRAMKKHGMIVADNGGAWYFGGTPDERWDNDDLAQLSWLRGNVFEAVDISGLMVSPTSYECLMPVNK